MRRFVVLFAFAGACKGTASQPTAAPSASHDADAGSVTKAPFACGAKPTCPDDHPDGDRALVDAIRTESAAGRIDRAAGLVACLGKKARLESDPGFSTLEPSPDSRYLLAEVDHDALVRVFDAKTWTETLRIDDAKTSASAADARAVVTHRAGGSTTWDLARQIPLDSTTSTAGVSAERSAIYWTETLPKRTLVIETAASTARVPIDTSEELTLAELPGSRFLASTTSGRHSVIDIATSTVLRAFSAGASVPARAAKDALVFDVGLQIEGFDDLFFAPSHAPLFVSLAEKLPPQPLSGPGCTKSVVVALSDDATRVVTRAADALCLFEVPSRKLLGIVKQEGRVSVSPARALVGGTFVGRDVVIAQLGSSVVRLRVRADGPDPLYDPKPLGSTVMLLASTRAGSIYAPIRALVRPPVDHVWVGATGQAATLEEVRSDGSVVSSNAALDSDSMVPTRVDPRSEHVIGPKGFEAVRSCRLTPPTTCVDLPLGGTFDVAPDGTWAAGPAPVDGIAYYLPAFAGHRVGALAVTSTNGVSLLLHHVPGFQAARFVSESELVLFGEDGVLLDCALATHACKRITTSPKGQFVRTGAKHLVVADETTVTSVPILGIEARAADVGPDHPRDRMRDQDKLFFEDRGLVVRQKSSALAVVDARTSSPVRELPMDSWAVLAAASTSPRFVALSSKELAVFDVETGVKAFTRKVTEYAGGDVAIDAAGTRIAFAQGDALRVIEVDGGKELARWRVPKAARIGISPDGKRIAAAIEQDLWLMDPSAPEKIEKVKLGVLGARTAHGASELSLTNGGFVAVTYGEGGVRLVSPARAVFTLARETTDDGVWLESKTGAAALGALSATSRGIGCRVGAWMIPREACLPSLCEAPLSTP